MTAVKTEVVRVFLLDDTRELRMRVRGALTEDEGLRVVGEADDPVDGLPLIEDLQPDVVVCDLSMPRMDGLEAIPRIADCAPDAGIAVSPPLTATPEHFELIADALESALQDYAD